MLQHTTGANEIDSHKGTAITSLEAFKTINDTGQRQREKQKLHADGMAANSLI